MKSLTFLLPVMFIFALATCGCSILTPPLGYGEVVNCPFDQKQQVIMFVNGVGVAAYTNSGQVYQSLYSNTKERADWIEDWQQDHPSQILPAIPNVQVQYQTDIVDNGGNDDGLTANIITSVIDWNPPAGL